jgi:hypothetical protein
MKGANMSYVRCRSIALIGIITLAYVISLNAQDAQKLSDPEKLTEEQKRDFLLNAKIVRGSRIGKGITNPFRLTLSDGSMVHDASFQSVDIYKPYEKFANGTTETNFRDSYKYNLAAFELAKLLGLDDMIPVTVERKWEGKRGAVSWWLPTLMTLGDKQKKKAVPPNMEAWNKSMYKVRVFTELVYDTDRSNPGNILIGNNWELYMIDFTRAFRLYTTLAEPKNLVLCDRQLLQRLRQLDAGELEQKTKDWLGSMEIKGVMARRDKIVALFEAFIAEKGESQVLTD